jgi:FlaG/FlaF family flagellin (archaellin)
MVQAFDNLIIGMKIRALKARERFEDESGVSAFVATILLIVIVVALCALFWDKISAWFTKMWTKIDETSDFT